MSKSKWKFVWAGLHEMADVVDPKLHEVDVCRQFRNRGDWYAQVTVHSVPPDSEDGFENYRYMRKWSKSLSEAKALAEQLYIRALHQVAQEDSLP